METNSVHQIAKSNFTLFVYGASGSLAKLKLFPALYELASQKRMPKDYQIIGYARTTMKVEEFKLIFEESVRAAHENIDKDIMKKLLRRVHYFSGKYDSIEDHKSFLNFVRKIEKEKKRVRIAYLSVPPSTFTAIFKSLGKVNFNTRMSRLRLIIEKPFGYDLQSAKKLKRVLYKSFQKEQIYLLDHYLGKEAVSNLLSLRYANSILSALLSKKYVSNIQISALESKDIEGRANYFDNVGILRDMIQSHLLQILAYFTMFAPEEKSSEAIHRGKAKVLKSIRIQAKNVVRGQYKSYKNEKGVSKDSTTETYAALKLTLNHKLWKGVPIYIRSGKALKAKWTAIVIEFKHGLLQSKQKNIEPNRLLIQLQPFEKIEFHLLTKLGGKTFDFHPIKAAKLIYCSGDCLSEHGRLFLEVVDGRQDLFLNFEEIFAAWRVIDPLQNYCNKMGEISCSPILYKKASLGPKAADLLIEKDGFKWFNAFPS